MEFTIRRATSADVPQIVELLADDPLGAMRERPGDPAYAEAFAEIDADPNQLLVVAEIGDEVVGTVHLTFTRGISSAGMLRANIEAMRIRSGRRGAGPGSGMVNWAIDEARRRGAGIVRLMSHASRERAHTFYERLGFTRSHVGMKLELR